jgi:hypothetical protein
VTFYLAAEIIEGATLGVEPLVSGVECEGEIIEGVELAGEVMGD